MTARIAPFGALLAITLCVAPRTAHAQDTLRYMNGHVIVGQVEEIGLEQIRYRTISSGNAVIVVVDKWDLASVTLKDGQVFRFTEPDKDGRFSPTFLGRKHAIHLDLVAPALDHLSVGYEQVLRPRVNLTARAGYIGLWDRNEFNDPFNSKGGLVAVGVKFILPHAIRRKPFFSDMHPLSGWYLRPEVVFSAWERTTWSYVSYDPYWQNYEAVKRTSAYSSAGLILTIGRQVFLGERFTFDINGGLGYGIQWRDGEVAGSDRNDPSRQEYAFSHAFLGGATPLVVSGGLRFGYVF